MSYLENLRAYELEQALAEMPSGKRVLEIGAGSGTQARLLSERGYQVQAIDVRASRHSQSRVWPVIEYDGNRIPFADASFDIVFSSNVLEHIPHLERFQAEIQRVLRLDGRAVHVVPSAGWRWWTNLLHYCHVVRYALGMFSGRSTKSVTTPYAGADIRSVVSTRGRWRLIREAILPVRHGERGNPVSELYYFSRMYWNRLFKSTGWVVRKRYSIRLMYSGYGCLGDRLPLRVREILSHILGGSSHVFSMERRDAHRESTGSA